MAIGMNDFILDSMDSFNGLEIVDEYPLANLLGTKLRQILSNHAQNGTASLVFGTCDAIMANHYVESGADSLFVSGATSSLLETAPNHNCGADLSDYTYDTVPGRVKSILQNQIQWARVDKARGVIKHDRLLPIIADADSGHGSATATMKMIRLFLEAGCAGIHIDDLVQGEKSFAADKTHAHVVVPWSEMRRRLKAVKLQLDICRSTLVVIGRTDVETASWITSTFDPLDRPFILGITGLRRDSFTGCKDQEAWLRDARFQTINEAAKDAKWPAPTTYHSWLEQSKGLNVSDAVRLARCLGADFHWDPDVCRNERGWYRYRGGTEAAISRSVLMAPFCDVLFSCIWGIDIEKIERYAREVHEVYPGKHLAMNWSILPKGLGTDEMKELSKRFGKLGYVWQCSPMTGAIAESLAVRKLCARAADTGVLAMAELNEEARAVGDPVVEWYGRAGIYTDKLLAKVSESDW